VELLATRDTGVQLSSQEETSDLTRDPWRRRTWRISHKVGRDRAMQMRLPVPGKRIS
jgi:hypothetical protein